MWRRVASLSRLASSFKSRLLDQVHVAYGFKAWQMFTTQVLQIGAEPDIVLFFYCPEEEMVRRVLNRNQGRIDDNIDTVKERLKVFAELNLPAIKHYSKKGKLYKIDASPSFLLH